MQINSNTETNGHEIQHHDSVSPEAMDNTKTTFLTARVSKGICLFGRAVVIR